MLLQRISMANHFKKCKTMDITFEKLKKLSYSYEFGLAANSVCTLAIILSSNA